MAVLIELTPFDPVTSARVTLRASSADDRRMTSLNNVRWWPAISEPPTLSFRLFDGDFSSAVSPGGANFSVLIDKLARMDANARRFLWAGAGVKIYAAAIGTAWPWPQVFEGKVDRFEQEHNTIKLQPVVDTEPFDKDVLTAKYAGTGGAEGDANLKGNFKPWLFGRALNVEPILIDPINSVFQFSAYGPIKAVNALYERASDFGASIADYATYAALVAATIPAGRWATCLASGMVRLGAPPYGVITGDVEGDYYGSVWRRTTGAIIERIAQNAGVSGSRIDSASLAALDTAVPYNINLAINQQTTVLALAQRLATPCNAQAGVSLLGKLFTTRMVFGTSALTLDAQGRRKPQVSGSIETDVRSPFWRVAMGAQRSWRVHTLDEIAFTAKLNPRGAYDNAQTYREGDMVTFADGREFLYIATTATQGNTPPNVVYWYQTKGTTVVDFADVTGGTKPDANATRNVPAGTHSTATTYIRGDLVNNAAGDKAYIAKQAVPTGIALTNTVYWDLFIQSTGGAAGANAFQASLSHTPIAIVTAADGSGGDYSAATGQMKIWEGAVDRTASANFALVGSPSWVSINSSGVYTVTNPGADQATAQFDASYGGVTLRLTLSAVKVKAGVAGSNGAPGADKFVWRAFADTPDGSGPTFTTGAPNGRAYQGEALNKTSSTESTNYIDYTWSPYTGPASFGLIATGNCIVGPTFALKNGGVSVWDSSAYSSESFTGGCFVSAGPGALSDYIIFGINTDPATNGSYETIDFAWYAAGSQWYIYESNTGLGPYYAVNLAELPSIRYTGTAIEYRKHDGTLVRSVAVAAGLTFWLDTSFLTPNARLNNIRWLPAGSDGADGAAGATGSPGATGNKIIRVYKRSASAVTAPTGNVPPSGWSTGVPGADGNPCYASDVETLADGVTVVGAYTSPVVFEAVAPTVATGNTFAIGAVVSRALSPGQSVYAEAEAFIGPLSGNANYRVRLQIRMLGGSFADFGTQVPEAGSTGDSVNPTCAGSFINSGSTSLVYEITAVITKTGPGSGATDNSRSFFRL
jgi:hypothetical protein